MQHTAHSAQRTAHSTCSSPGGRPSRRPVSWSLHKYWGPSKSSSCDSLETVLPSPEQEVQLCSSPPAARGGAALQQELAAEEQAVAEAQQLVPAESSQLVQKPAQRSQRQRGGRPKKAPGLTKARYVKRLSAQQKLEWVKWLQLRTGQKLKGGLQHVARQTGAAPDTVRGWQKQKARLEQFVQEHQPGKFSARKQGDWTACSKLQNTSRGCRLPGKRGYLGRTNHCRDLVLKTQAWAEAEAACGHSLAASDLLRQFRLLLANAIDTAKAAQAEAEPTEAAKAQLQHFLKKKARLDESTKARLGQARYLTARTSLLTAAAQLIDRSSMQQPGTAYSSSIQQQTADSSILNYITAWLPGPATSTRPRTCRLS